MNPTEQRAKATTLAALLTPVAVGLIYVGVSCERYSPGAGKCESQWVTALAIGGMGGAWSAGFWQPNQALRERDRRLLQGEPTVPGVEPEPLGDPLPDPDTITPPEPLALDEPAYTGPELARLTVDQLRALARQAGITGLSHHGRRAELVAALLGTPRGQA
jgi:hypothetical protein